MARRATVLGVGALGVSAVLALGVGLAATPASAAPREATALLSATGDPAAAGTPKNGRLMKRLDRACDRIPNLIKRSENLEDRLAADADSPGSIAHLQARIEKAKAAGKTDLVTVLENRLVVRKDLQELLPGRIEQLKKAQTGICVDVDKALAK